MLADYGNNPVSHEPLLVAETAWKAANWELLKDALIAVEESCPPAKAHLLHLYRGYLLVAQQMHELMQQHHPPEHHVRLF